jgi:hypothetical protein
VLVEGLRRAGKELTREKLVAALEGFYEYQVGLLPPLTFHANRRIGALGAHVVSVDLQRKDLVLAGGWMRAP